MRRWSGLMPVVVIVVAGCSTGTHVHPTRKTTAVTDSSVSGPVSYLCDGIRMAGADIYNFSCQYATNVSTKASGNSTRISFVPLSDDVAARLGYEPAKGWWDRFGLWVLLSPILLVSALMLRKNLFPDRSAAVATAAPTLAPTAAPPAPAPPTPITVAKLGTPPMAGPAIDHLALSAEFIGRFLPTSVPSAHELLYDVDNRHAFAPGPKALDMMLRKFSALVVGTSQRNLAGNLELLDAYELALAWTQRGANAGTLVQVSPELRQQVSEISRTIPAAIAAHFGERFLENDAVKRLTAIGEVVDSTLPRA